MDISKEIKNGSITIYTDTDPEVERAAAEYNKLMTSCRRQMKIVKEVEFALSILNPLVIVCMYAGSAETVWQRPVLALILLLINAVVFVAFVLVRKNFIITTAASAVMMVLDIRFAILAAADIVLLVIYMALNKKMKSKPGYPSFVNVRIDYKRYKSYEQM